METITLLVVEDNPGDARLIEEYLKTDTTANYLISFATTLDKTLETLSNKKFDVILVDLGLPDSQGIYTFNEIISASPKSPIVIVTGTDNETLGIEAIRYGALNYMVKSQINSTLLVRTIKFAIEIKRKNVELKDSHEKYCSIFEGAASLIISLNSAGEIIDCNNSIEKLLGYSKDEVMKQPFNKILHQSSHKKAEKIVEEAFKKGIVSSGEYKMIRKDGGTIIVNIHTSALKGDDNENFIVSCIINDITDRVYYDKKQQLITKILSILNTKNEWQKLMHDILFEIKKFSQIEAIGIRYKKGEDYPYFSAIGFPDSFLKKENSLCARNKAGDIISDPNGKIILECMCGNIISKRTDQFQRFITENGSFWTNSTTNLMATTTDKNLQLQTCNYCNASGYESVALIPLISDHETIGLLQLNDKHKEIFNKEMIHLFEELGIIIGIAFKRINIEKAITDSEIRYRRLFESAKDGILILDHETGVIMDVNPFLIKLLGYSKEELLQKAIWEIGFIKDIFENKSKFLELQQQDYVRYEDLPLKTIKGGQVHVEFVSNVYLENGIKVIQCNIRDITERKLADAALILSKEHAEESDRLKTAFLQNMSHEIRTPMNGILGFASLLKEPDLSFKKQKEFIEVIEQSGQRMLSIINDIVNISKIETGLVEVEIKEINLNQIIKNLYSFFKPEADSKGLKLFYNTELNDELCKIETDETKLTQVLSNLLKNALKFTNAGSIDFGYHQKGDMIEFYVKDTGIGVSPEMHETIFKRFRQVEVSVTRNYDGAGLGLAISKAFVEKLGGEIWVESELGKGSAFYFNIPNHSIKTILVEKSVKTKTNGLTQDINILIADDDATSLLLLKNIFENENANLFFANNGKEALESVKQNPKIQIALLDLKMPVMDGFEATRLIKKFNPFLPVIAQSAYAFSEELEKARLAGCDDFISKPVKRELLLSMVNKHLSNLRV
jgi:PAS domain S-box-containing protein